MAKITAKPTNIEIDDADVAERVASILADRWEDSVLRRVDERLDGALSDALDAKAKAALDEWFASASIRSTNEYGEQTGEPVRVQEWLLGRLTKHMTEKVSSTGYTDRSGNETRQGYLARKMAESVLKDAAETVRRELEAAFAPALADGLLKELRRALAAALKLEKA